MIKTITSLLVFMYYIFIESIVVGLLIWLAIKFLLKQLIVIDITYIQIVIIVWIIKATIFNFFNASIMVNHLGNLNENNEEVSNSEN